MTTEEQYRELIRAIGKEHLSGMIKAHIRQNFPEPLATIYSQQFDDANKLADFLEWCAKYVRGNRV